MGCSQAVRHQTLTLAFRWFEPIHPSQKNPRTCSEDFFIQAKGLAWHQPLGCMESRYTCMASPTGAFLWLDSIRHNVSIPYCNKLQIPYNANALIFQSISIRLVATLCRRQSLHPSQMLFAPSCIGSFTLASGEKPFISYLFIFKDFPFFLI